MLLVIEIAVSKVAWRASQFVSVVAVVFLIVVLVVVVVAVVVVAFDATNVVFLCG
jgi:hypothetical protein